MMKRKILLLISLLCGIGSYSQNPTTAPESLFKQPIVVTPDMAALARNIAYPINYSTGTPEISIPLYTIQCGSLTLPISLAYNASGIRVDDVCGIVGQGWSLTGIPTISRKVNGHIDAGYVCEFDENTTVYDKEYVKRLLDGQNPYSSNDEQPDEYYYQLAGKSGLFMYLMRPERPEFAYASLPYNNVKIERENAFKITDDDGTVYRFDGAEDNADFPNAPAVVSGWKASSMVSANGVDSILFSYDGVCAYPIRQNNESYTVVDGFESNDGLSRWPRDILYTNYYDINYQYVPGCEIEEVMKAPVVYHTLDNSRFSYQVDDNGSLYSDNQPVSGPLGFWSSLNTRSAALKTISFKGNTITFGYTGNNSTIRLTSIVIRNSLGEIVRTVRLDYDFCESNNRCFLKSVSFVDTLGHDIEKYSFEYESPNSLPPTGDKRIDFWGYYNGNRQGGSLVPRMTIQTQVDYPRWHNPQYYSNTTLTIGATNWDNRASDETYMKCGSLKSITYPTGSKDEFLFEANQIKFSGTLQESDFNISEHLVAVPGKTSTYYVGGLRIKQIKSTIGDSVVNYRSFVYNNDGTGTSPINDSTNYFLSEKTKYYYETFVYDDRRTQASSRYRTISSTPLLPLTFSNGAVVMYEKVTEYNGQSESDNEGKTVYQYSVPTYKWDVVDVYERLNHKYEDWQYGHLTSKTVYKKNANNYLPLLKEEYMYTSNCNVGYAWVGEYEINTIINLPSEGEHSSYPHEWDNNFFSGARQSYPFFSHVPREKRITVYDNNGHYQVTTDSFSYSIPYCTLMTEKRIRRNNTVYSESYEYPYDQRSSSPYNAMVEKNILSPVIKSTYNRDGKTFVTMTPFNSMYKPAAIKTSFNGSSLMERVNYLYDDNGNKIQASKDGRENAVFLYGYNNQYPVAVIENTTWAAVLSTLGSNFVQSLRQSSQPSAYQWSRFNQLRTTNKDWHITTYKYKPLVGVTSVIDPSGKETRFFYDALGRLIKKSIYTNGTEKVLEKYEYNYKTNQHE